MTNDSKSGAEYVRMAEDCLDQSWEAGESQEFRTLSVARAQVYATLALVADNVREENVRHYADLEEREMREAYDG